MRHVLCKVAFLALWTGLLFAQNPNTAAFPGAPAADTDLLVQSNSAQTTLNGGIDDSTLSITLTSAANFTFPGIITIGSERIKVCSKATHTLTVCTGGRGFGGTAAAAHSTGVDVYGYLTAYEHNQLAAEIKAMQAKLPTGTTPPFWKNESSGTMAAKNSGDTNYAPLKAASIQLVGTENASEEFYTEICTVGTAGYSKVCSDSTLGLAVSENGGTVAKILTSVTGITAAAVIGDTKVLVGSGGARGVAASGLTATVTKMTAGVPSASTASDLGTMTYAVGGGTAQAQTVTLAPAATWTTGLTVRWLPAAANTAAAPTLAVNGTTATAITKCGAAALVANDLTLTAVAIATYDGTQYQLLNPQAAGCGAAGGAPANAHYITTQAETGLSAESSLGGLTDNNIVAVDISAGVATPRSATAADIVTTFASGSCSGYLKSDGTCDAGTGTNINLFMPFPNTGNSFAINFNTTRGHCFYLPNQGSFSKVWVNVGTADTGHNYTIGFYAFNGSLIASTGSIAGPGATGYTSLTLSGGPISFSAGHICFAVTGASGGSGTLALTEGQPGIVSLAESQLDATAFPASISGLTETPAIVINASYKAYWFALSK